MVSLLLRFRFTQTFNLMKNVFPWKFRNTPWYFVWWTVQVYKYEPTPNGKVDKIGWDSFFNLLFGPNKIFAQIQCRIRVDLKLTAAKKRDPDFTRFGRNAQEDALNRIFLVRPTKRSDNTNEELHGRFMVPWNTRKNIFYIWPCFSYLYLFWYK